MTEFKARLTLIALCLLVLGGVFVDHALRPDPPTKGFCPMCGAVQHAVNP